MSKNKSNIFFYSELCSTMTKARDLLSEGVKPPFTVLAGKQTSGRGRRGADWKSPKGGIYLTMALPSNADKVKHQGTLPLKSAVVVAEWLRRSLGIRITLKWPNDLLFGGRKLGGILCEGSSQGEERGDVLIGIGINILAAPRLSSLATISLSEIKNKEYKPKLLARSLVEFWRERWPAIQEKEIISCFEEYALEEKHLWVNEVRKNEFFQNAGFTEDGGLILNNFSQVKEKIILNSADHGFSWIYQGRINFPLICADVGNTAVKVGYFNKIQDRRPAEVFSELAGSPEIAKKLQDFSRKLPDGLGGFFPVFTASVNKDNYLLFESQATQAGLAVIPLKKRPLLRIDNDSGYLLSNLGLDRLAMIEACLSMYNSKERGKGLRTAVIIGVGTVTTIDVVSSSGRHFGGLILPGPGTAVSGMANVAEQLPKIEMEFKSSNILGHNTTEAMLCGITQMTIGAIERTILQVKKKYRLTDRQIDLILTGGHAFAISSQLKYSVKPFLSLEGIRTMVLGGD